MPTMRWLANGENVGYIEAYVLESTVTFEAESTAWTEDQDIEAIICKQSLQDIRKKVVVS